MGDSPVVEGQGDRKHSLAFIHCIMILCALLVSTSFTVGKAVAHGLDPAVLTLVRFLLATLFLTPYIFITQRMQCSFSLVWRCGLISLSLVIFFWSMFLSLRYTTALNTSVIFTLVPSIAGFYAIILVKEKLSAAKLIALTCGLVGAIWVIFQGDVNQMLAMQWNKGDVIFLGGCFAMGLYTPLVQLLHRGEPMVVITYGVLVTGSMWLLLVSGYRLGAIAWEAVPLSVWLGVSYLALFTTVFSFFLTQYSIPYIGATKVMAYSYLYPTLVLVLDILLGKGWPGSGVLPGVFIVLIAMFVLQRSAENSSRR